MKTVVNSAANNVSNSLVVAKTTNASTVGQQQVKSTKSDQ